MASTLLLAGCAAAAQTQFSTAGVGPVAGAVECAAEAVEDEGFAVTHRDDAGILHAQSGTDRLEVTVVPGAFDRHVIEVEASDSEAARDAAEDIVTECGR